jgi:hypothetical protein
MRFVALIVTVLFTQNAFAQTSESTEQPEQPTAPESLGEYGDPARSSCLQTGDQTQCCTEYGTCVQSSAEDSEQCATVARLCGHQNLDAALQDGCQQRNAIVQGSECACSSGLQWNSGDKTCCTTNPAVYERRRSACDHSGGTYHCNDHGGWCGCPLGMSHPIDEDGHTDRGICSGEAVNRERIQAMRDEIATLTAQAEEAGRQIAALQDERDALRRQLDQAQADLALAEELERQLAELEHTIDETGRQLAVLDQELFFLRNLRGEYERHIARQNEMISELGGIPPAVPTPSASASASAPLPGTREAIAEAASESGPSPLAPTPPPEEGEEAPHFCNASFGGVLLCYFLPAAALAGLGVGIACAAGACDSDKATISWGYNDP